MHLKTNQAVIIPYMIVFIDDRPIRIIGRNATDRLESHDYFDKVIDARLGVLKESALHGHLLLLNATPATAEKLNSLLQSSDASHLLSVTLVCLDKEAVEDRFKTLYKVVKAAGGVVFKGNKMLLMFRRGVWDLPKGKLDDGESSQEGAMREVEEETGVRVDIEEKICTTWHTYTLNGNRILKRTKWYRMVCIDDRKMAPQEDEDIEKLAWMDSKQTQMALTNSFSSIRYVIESLVK